MSLPDNVEIYQSGSVKLHVHHQPTGEKNYWLFSSVAGLEIKEEDIGSLGELLTAYHDERLTNNSKLKWLARVLWVLVLIIALFIIGGTLGAFL